MAFLLIAASINADYIVDVLERRDKKLKLLTVNSERLPIKNEDQDEVCTNLYG